MEEKKVTKEELREYLRGVLHFETEDLLAECVDHLHEGRSIVLDALSYLGNGRHEKRTLKYRYKYKMIVPILDKNNRLYSTDLFISPKENAEKGCYGVYCVTRQLAIGLVNVLETDYSNERFGHGYRDGKYGSFKIKK